MRADGNLVGEVVRLGDIVTVNRPMRELRYNGNYRLDLEPGRRFTVSRVYTNRLMIRTIDYISGHGSWQGDSQWSFSVDRGDVIFADENYVPPPPPRKLGVKPEDTEDLVHIDVSDPRIQWIWDDLGRYADNKNWCPQYDELCRDVGVPGRPRDFNVTRTLNGIQIRASIKARSQAEANEMFARAMSTPAE